MTFFRSGVGLIPEFPSPVEGKDLVDEITEEAGLRPPSDRNLHLTALVKEGEHVARGAVVACVRQDPDICLVAPIAGQVGRISRLPGRRLSEIVFFREESGGTQRHDTAVAETERGLRRLLQTAGFWPRITRRPFGGMPASREVPAAIFVMATDTRPYASDPRQALVGREAAFLRGLAALARLSKGPTFVCWDRTTTMPAVSAEAGDIRMVPCGTRHPQGSAGIRIHQDFPAGLEAPVWDVHAEDIADLGDLLETGELPMMRLVRISGAGLREGRLLRTHPGADLRQLSRRIVAPGSHSLHAGSHLDGQASRWLGHRHRQVTVLPNMPPPPRSHWLLAALIETARPRPAIPTAALGQSLGGALPAIPLIRALGAGDDEAAMDLGLLSLLEEDLALADYTLGAGGDLMRQLRAMLDRIQTEYDA
ncbi:Na(+)-translocating NADH-quinone reductase subunit A [Jannaschia seohaensis]|uniref:Na+-transporting NADH:ubiquinone oxidoreductase subunit A n=1 Tax=Jannaschia seohaensis TaxID=475081 RepID=A0A2Y9AUY5_9RHOB|nr:Na(+)-translocating NADH-quinone reductase subunit A [Jannaschia seohaensis]PWJ16952.1 Na+-transporting NADH:ubiquinone oxidoreductase subunit A [Jannaschia seohaensis]SSA48184.1 Na+-transporting NADH:ubiquinone oxidoreductase subunit A [Jannaschia seohaensis]